MKKIVALILILIMTLSFAGCQKTMDDIKPLTLKKTGVRLATEEAFTQWQVDMNEKIKDYKTKDKKIKSQWYKLSLELGMETTSENGEFSFTFISLSGKMLVSPYQFQNKYAFDFNIVQEIGILNGEKIEEPNLEFTRGHFKRGIV